jgi:hypothetical protein
MSLHVTGGRLLAVLPSFADDVASLVVVVVVEVVVVVVVVVPLAGSVGFAHEWNS